MRDWSALVHRRLASVRIDERRRPEIAAELAAHLEDAYDSAIRNGCSEAEAIACAMERVPDWRALAVAVERSTDEDAIMTRQALTTGDRELLVHADTVLTFSISGEAGVELGPEIRCRLVGERANHDRTMLHLTEATLPSSP